MKGFIISADAASDLPTPEDALQWESGLELWEQNAKSHCKKNVAEPKKQRKKTKKPDAKPYGKKWLARARFASRWMAGMRKSKRQFGISGMSAKRFSRLVPDSGKWMLRMGPRGEGSMKALLKKLRFTNMREVGRMGGRPGGRRTGSRMGGRVLLRAGRELGE